MMIDPTFQVGGKVVLNKPYDGVVMSEWLTQHVGVYGKNWLTLIPLHADPVVVFSTFGSAVAFALAFDLVPQ